MSERKGAREFHLTRREGVHNNNTSVKKKKKKKKGQMGNRSKYIRQTIQFSVFFLLNATTCDGIDWMNMSLRLAANDSFSGRQGCGCARN